MAWNKGPLPPDTYQWGGVVLVGEEASNGFYFADFRGDHVLIMRDDWERIEPDQVAWWNNGLDLPPEAKGRSVQGPPNDSRPTVDGGGK